MKHRWAIKCWEPLPPSSLEGKEWLSDPGEGYLRPTQPIRIDRAERKPGKWTPQPHSYPNLDLLAVCLCLQLQKSKRSQRARVSVDVGRVDGQSREANGSYLARVRDLMKKRRKKEAKICESSSLCSRYNITDWHIPMKLWMTWNWTQWLKSGFPKILTK